ncbi:pyruvate, phosphate dikinase [uncultured Allofournierella sp.]|uniref:pyruvate, phosphate dikinase n=1 Tax=uncultured Allofournierella sp. TaxID=1940258 RepID=UPI003752F0D9
MVTKKRYIYLFSEGNKDMVDILGGKGANLAEMTNIGLPVPQGFTISTEACTQYYQDGRQINPEILADIYDYVGKLEELTGKKFGSPTAPLLVSVRSGARKSMPGMLDTVLNLGMNDQVAEALATSTGNGRFVYDSYRRFVQMFSDVVMELPTHEFEDIIDQVKQAKGVTLDTELDEQDLRELVFKFKSLYKSHTHTEFPSDPRVQLTEAIKAVFRSWDNPRANVYRRMHEIPYEWGTAVNVQRMVFGNSGPNSGSGVAFTRNPATGERVLYGEYLMNAQGEDVVAGIRTPKPLAELEHQMPQVYAQFSQIARKLENHYRDMQDMEFTIEDGQLYMLQTRSGKRTTAAAVKIAVDMVDEGMITKEEAILRVDAKQLDNLLHPQFDPQALKQADRIGQGLAASPGAACGQVVFTAQDAKQMVQSGQMPKVVLVRLETSPEDIEGMAVAQGILTVRGGMTSHAAVVARGMGTCCVSGCGDITVDYAKQQFTLAGKTFCKGDWISLDGATGCIYGEKLATVSASIGGDFLRFMNWADSLRHLRVFANADNPRDARQAIEFGAEGIGLCRTEHMFFEADRIQAMREMIVAENVVDRKKALAKILPYQQGDFEAMYRVLGQRPMTIRFLDPPLHEFLPTSEQDMEALAKELNTPLEHLRDVVNNLHEFNPMMGHRGCRLAVSYPEIAQMQTTAVINAAIRVSKETGLTIVPHIMIPLVGEATELKFVKDVVTATADRLIAASGLSMQYQVGTMIEIPRAALTANEIAAHADFFSFGTNDLTQMTFGFSRDDAGKFLPYYYEHRIYEQDPFAHLDQKGVGKLMELAVTLGRSARPDLGLGICGEHGGDPSSVEFCHKLGLDYVSCSPFRVPIARLAAAQAAIKNSQ